MKASAEGQDTASLQVDSEQDISLELGLLHG